LIFKIGEQGSGDKVKGIGEQGIVSRNQGIGIRDQGIGIKAGHSHAGGEKGGRGDPAPTGRERFSYLGEGCGFPWNYRLD